MSENRYKYVIAGGELAGASAVGGIRKKDKEGSILLMGEVRCGKRLSYKWNQVSLGMPNQAYPYQNVSL